MFDIAIILIFLALGYGFGQLAEKRHYRRIIESEKELNELPAIASRFPPSEGDYEQQLVTGSVVIATDYFKTFLAGLVNFFGGSVVSYESLLDRARREAMLRMKKEARTLNAELIFNVKFETATVGGRAPSMEVLAYGTALTPASQVVASTGSGYDQPGNYHSPGRPGVGESVEQALSARLVPNSRALDSRV